MSRALLIACLAACAEPSSSAALAIETIVPAAAPSTDPVAIAITGQFHLPFVTDLDQGATLVALPRVIVGDLELTNASWQSDVLIAGEVPAGLPVGTYDVTVALGERSATLPQSYTVLDTTPPPPAIPFELSGDDWLLPCIANGTPNPNACTCQSGSVVALHPLEGAPGERWHVTVRIRGVMEQYTYTGGTAVDGTGWYIGGIAGGGNNTYKLTISAPAATYWINNGPAVQSNSWVFDYEATFDLEAGATVSLESSGSDGIMWEGVDAADQPLSVPGITDPAQPYNGQWAQLDVIAAVPY